MGAVDDYAKLFVEADESKDGLLQLHELKFAAGKLGVSLDVLALRDEQVDQKTFAAKCTQVLGAERKVVLKYMQARRRVLFFFLQLFFTPVKSGTICSWTVGVMMCVCVSLQDEQQWRRERNAREKHKLDARFVIQTLPAPPEEAVNCAVEKGEGGLQGFVEEYLPEGMTLGRRVIVMEKADRNLQEIYQKERPDLNVIRVYMQQVLEALRDLHSKGLAHLDVKAPNIVRLAVDNRLRLIDLDAAARIDHEVSEK